MTNSLLYSFESGQPCKSKPMSWAEFEQMLDDLDKANPKTKRPKRAQS